MKKVIVVGGGAAGMMAAIIASKQHEVMLIEKNEKLGKKLYITGKGRCNLTNASDVTELIENTCKNSSFMYSSFYQFDSEHLMNFFENLGLPLKVERGNRVFPQSEKSIDVINILERELIKNKVKICFNTTVKQVMSDNNKITGVEVDLSENKSKFYKADAVIIATGGLSYPSTGSTGDGYKFAKVLGHKVTKLYPSLVPLKVEEEWSKDLQGLSLKNVGITVKTNKKVLYQSFGEMIFTHFGVSGPIILSASSYLTSIDRAELYIDLKPALTEKEIDMRLLKDFSKYKNKNFNNCLDDLLPQKMIDTFITLSEIDPSKKANEITKHERKRLLDLLKNFKLTIIGSTGYREAVITSGGVDIKEINPKTMESKLIKGLYFAGEIIDVDAFTGGFNLQIAFSTGYAAGLLDCEELY